MRLNRVNATFSLIVNRKKDFVSYMYKKNIGITKNYNLYKNIFVRGDFNVYHQCHVDFKICKKKVKEGTLWDKNQILILFSRNLH